MDDFSDINGNNLLSGIDVRLWSLQQEVIYRWHTYCIFTYRHINVPKRQASHILFYVPRNATFCYEIAEYLNKELESVRCKPIEDECGYWPGTKVDVTVVKFSAIEPHLDSEIVEKMAKEFMKELRQKVTKWKKKKKDEES